jgi:hypothetical protein
VSDVWVVLVFHLGLMQLTYHDEVFHFFVVDSMDEYLQNKLLLE